MHIMHAATSLMTVRMNVPRLFNIPTVSSAKKAKPEAEPVAKAKAAAPPAVAADGAPLPAP